jgi:hypothetical protein
MVVTGPINPSPKYIKLKLQSSLSDGPTLMMRFLGETHQGQSPKCEAPQENVMQRQLKTLRP